MMKNIVGAAALMALIGAPTMAQVPPGGTSSGLVDSAAECQANWKRADVNADGFLGRAEVDAAGALIPTTLLNRDRINQQEFLTACRTTVQQSKK